MRERRIDIVHSCTIGEGVGVPLTHLNGFFGDVWQAGARLDGHVVNDAGVVADGAVLRVLEGQGVVLTCGKCADIHFHQIPTIQGTTVGVFFTVEGEYYRVVQGYGEDIVYVAVTGMPLPPLQDGLFCGQWQVNVL